MAEIKQPTVNNCGEPELPEGPYITYCGYEYVAFYECRGSGGAGNASTVFPIGQIGTYSGGGNGTANGSVVYKDISPSAGADGVVRGYAGNPIAIAYVGKVGAGWMDYFVSLEAVNQGFVGQWFAAAPHNYLTNRYHIKIAKYIHIEMHVLSKEDLYGDNEPEEGNEIWECPSYPQFSNSIVPNNQNGQIEGVEIDEDATIPLPQVHDFGQDVCPKYFQIDPCVDCAGNTDPDLSSMIFEIQDRKHIVDNNQTIIEYPNDSHQCYSWTQILPQNQQGILPRSQLQGYAAFDDCDECKRDYWVVIISPVNAVDFFRPNSLTWAPSFAVSIPPGGNQAREADISMAVNAGKMTFRRMDKSDANNQAFVTQLRDRNNPHELIYLGQDGVCYRAYVADPSECLAPALSEWTHWTYNARFSRATRDDDPVYIHSATLTVGAKSVFYEDDPEDKPICDCLDKNGTVGITNETNCNPPPTITKHPEEVEIELCTQDENVKDISLTYTVQAKGDNLEYKWFRSYQTGVTQLNSNTNTVTFTRKYQLSESHDGNNVNHFVYCEVSNGGGTPVRSKAARIIINKTPCKLHDDDEPTRLVTVKVWCLSQAQANSMLKTGAVRGVKTPEQASLPTTTTHSKYIDPDLYDANAGDSYYVGKYYIQTGGEGACGGADHVVYKVTSIRVMPWKDVGNAFKGVSNPANDDEQRLTEFILPNHAISKKAWGEPGGDAETMLRMSQF